MTAVRRTGALVVLALLASPVAALDTPNERITLVGVTGVHLVIDEPGEDAEREGLTRASLEADISRRLRTAGLRVLTPSEALASAGRPTLPIRVAVVRTPDSGDLYAYSVDLAFRQQVRLTRDRAVESYAVTWNETRSVGIVRAGRFDPLRHALSRKVEQFITAWRTSNQERY